MIDRNTKPLYGKVVIRGGIRAETGLHVGGAEAELNVGGIDSFVIKNHLGEPYIPGSSLKGKMRHIVERKTQAELGPDFKIDHQGGTAQNEVFRHECLEGDEEQWKGKSLRCPVCRLFGKSRKDTRTKFGLNIPSRLIVRDSPLSGESRELLQGLGSFTEVKGENALDRVTAAANPRFIERVPPGVVFDLEIIYDVEEPGDIEGDFANIAAALHILEEDGIGGHISRGYGKVAFAELEAEVKSIMYYESPDERFKENYPLAGPAELRRYVTRIKEFCAGTVDRE